MNDDSFDFSNFRVLKNAVRRKPSFVVCRDFFQEARVGRGPRIGGEATPTTWIPRLRPNFYDDALNTACINTRDGFCNTVGV